LATIEGHRPVATTQRVIRNVLSNSAGKIITLGINLLLTPVLVWHLGAANYGLLTVIGSVATYGSLLDFGMLNTVIKYVAGVSRATRSSQRIHRHRYRSGRLFVDGVGGGCVECRSGAGDSSTLQHC
jgi:hypothetical protein